ncbi:unnamed protein product [Owenia fusiformis]|uniref:Uncharacterized protein n=1 Tax=Owenia fusiformis TaxID=6347 RepID=A0A8J1US02_OWEFU|nr:unnamed protein product [Owenia fusiformis]
MISQSKAMCLLVAIVATTILLANLKCSWNTCISSINPPAPSAKRSNFVGYNGSSYITQPRSNIYLNGFEEKNRNRNLVLYSRSPKCGSTTLNAVMKAACEYGGKYTFNNLQSNAEPLPKKSELKTVAKKRKFALTHLLQESPTIVIGHLSFFDFIELGYKQPLFIDIVRDPVERWISHYYYFRSSERHIKNLKFTDKDINQPFEECFQIWKNTTGCSGMNITQTAACLVRKGRNKKGCLEFQVDHSFYSYWFSGKYSTNRSLISSANAKSNIEKYYAFVGLTEHLNETVRAMERVLPRFTDEMSRAYNDLRGEHVKNRSLNKKRPSNETIAVMKEYTANDYDLYRFISQRFYRHLNRLGIKLT